MTSDPQPARMTCVQPWLSCVRPHASSGKRIPQVDSSCRLLIVPLFRGSSRFESLILSHHSRFNVTCECNTETINDDEPCLLRNQTLGWLPGKLSRIWFRRSVRRSVRRGPARRLEPQGSVLTFVSQAGKLTPQRHKLARAAQRQRVLKAAPLDERVSLGRDPFPAAGSLTPSTLNP